MSYRLLRTPLVKQINSDESSNLLGYLHLCSLPPRRYNPRRCLKNSRHNQDCQWQGVENLPQTWRGTTAHGPGPKCLQVLAVTAVLESQ